MKYTIILITIFLVITGPSAPKDYPTKTPPGANGTTETVRK